MIVLELTEGWPLSLKQRLDAYFTLQHVDLRHVLRVDLVLALLRIGGEDALERASELTGRPITKCPSAVPPWPPKPPPLRAALPRVTKIGEPPSEGTEMHGRFMWVRVGMTREQLLRRGITPRDIRYWEKTDRLEFSKGAQK